MRLRELLHNGNFFERYTGTISIQRVCDNVIWLIRLRWIACIGLLFGVIFSKAFFHIDAEVVFPPLLIGLIILFYNFIFYLRYSFLKKRKVGIAKECVEKRLSFVNIQIFADLIMLSAIIYYTGGITTPIIFFFIFHMVISSIVLSRLNAYFWAFFTIIIESVMTYLEHIEIIEHKNFFYFIHKLNDRTGYSEFFILIVFSITLIITVYFATTIMRPIREKQLDLTKIKNELLEQKEMLNNKNIELEELDKSKTEFLYRVEHELKAPISAVLGLLSVVTRGYESVDESKKIDFLNRSINRVISMKDLVADLLSLSRIESKNFKLNLKNVHMAKLIENCIEELGAYSRKKQILIKKNIGENLPEINADRDALKDIIRNLIHNAIKYSFQGHIAVSLFLENDRLIFSVKDFGIGIAEDDLSEIFEEFYRTSNAKEFESGTGLGLSLVKKLVEQHSGRIDIKSKLNTGTECIVSFPVEPLNVQT